MIGIGTSIASYWREMGIAALIVLAFHLQGRAEKWHDKTVACETNRKADKEAYKAAAEKAKADNLATVRATEKKWEGVVTQTEENYSAKLAAANAAVRSYALRVRLQSTVGRNPGQAGVPPTPGASEGVDGTGQDAVVPVTIEDLNICAENTVKATSWQIFWKGITDGQAK